MNDNEDTHPIDDTHQNQNALACKYFKNLEEAKEYAKKNAGSTFVKNHNGPGYILKDTNIKNRNEPELIVKSKREENKKNNHHQEEKLKDNITHGRPARSGLYWRDQEVAQLIKLHSSGQNINQISNELKRSILGVSNKLSNLELISKEELQKYLEAHSSTPS